MKSPEVQFTPEDRLILDSYCQMLDGLAQYLGTGYELVLHSLEDLEHSAIRVMNSHTGRSVSRMLYSSAVEVTPDKQGRIQLPARLREYAGLDHYVTVIGNRSFAEIWNTAAWNGSQESSDEDFTAALAALDF